MNGPSVRTRRSTHSLNRQATDRQCRSPFIVRTCFESPGSRKTNSDAVSLLVKECSDFPESIKLVWGKLERNVRIYRFLAKIDPARHGMCALGVY